MNTNKNKLYIINEQGHLEFPLRRVLFDRATKSDSLWESPNMAAIIMATNMVLDSVLFYQPFSRILYDSPHALFLSILAMLIGFDLAPIYLGIVLKKRSQGLKSEMVLVVILVTAFTLAFVGNILLRIELRDQILPDYSDSGTSLMGIEETNNTNSHLALLYAIFCGFLPVITSLVSFGISFLTSNPLKARYMKAKKEQILLEDCIVQLEATLLEYNSDSEKEVERLMEEDEKLYMNTKNILREQACYYADYTREKIKEHLGDAASNNELSKSNRKALLKLYHGISDNEILEKLIG